jgi:hypothetical protein
MSDAVVTPAPTPEPDPREREERARIAADRLSRVNGPRELAAVVLALMLPPGSRRALRAWHAETADTPEAAAWLEHVNALAPPARLPWFERLLSRLRGQPLAARQALLEATRRLMAARGTVRPIDRLHWMAMRLRLGESSAAEAHSPAAAGLSRLPDRDVLAIASFSAFLSRMVPVDAAIPAPPSSAPSSAPAAAQAATGPAETQAGPTAGQAWYDTVMTPWRHQGDVAACHPPDNEGMVHALQTLQEMPWMQRPVLVRDWVDAALRHSRHRRLGDSAADALRLCCALLECPLPPDLERHYGEPLVLPPA